jgi:hypothetical protein
VQNNEPQLTVTRGDTLTVVWYQGATGYCLSAHAAGSANTWYYDSGAGGLQPLGVGCSAITSGSAGGSLTG